MSRAVQSHAIMVCMNTQTTSSNTAPTHQRRLGVTILAISLCIAVVCLSVFAIFKISTHACLQRAATITLPNDITGSPEKMGTIEESIEYKNIQNQLDKFKTRLDQLTAYEHPSTNAVVQEALDSAYVQLRFNGDTETACELLHFAASKLNTEHTANAEAWKAKIIADMDVLKTIPASQQNERLTEIQAIITEIDNVSIIPSAPIITPEPLIADGTPWKDWRHHLNHTLAVLRSLIVIHKIDAENGFLLTPEQTLLCKQLAMSQLLQTQWAILHHNPTVFTQSLISAKNMLAQLNISENSKQLIIDRMDALLANPITDQRDIALTTIPEKISCE